MKITKYGHACLLIEEAGVRILLDPGAFNEPPQVEELDAILVTHEHQDHCSVEQIRELLLKSPGAQIVTHEAVGKVLGEAGIEHTIIEDGGAVSIKGVEVVSYGVEHAVMHEKMPSFRNTGFMIAGRFYFPGDSFHVPGLPVEILALPVGGPWMRYSEAADFAMKIAPKYAFPVHDGMFIADYHSGVSARLGAALISSLGIDYRHMGAGSVEEF